MATPLYKFMKRRGTSFYAFPSAAEDMNLAFSNDNYKINFTKFVLLNIPEQEVVIKSGVDRDQTRGVMNFDKDENGPRFYNFQPGGNNDLPTNFADQLIESLRNYVANYDATLRESRINPNTDFYNINERVTPTEMIFWKWCRKLNLIDLEPATHKVDWDKNLPDFDNPNGTTPDFFRKYLWKEREVIYYPCTLTQHSNNNPIVTIQGNAKFKNGDYVYLSGNTGTLSAQTIAYEVKQVIHTSATTSLVLNVNNYTDSNVYNCVVYLKYHRLVEYIGEIQAVSKVQTSKRNFTEITAQIPHHAGRTPTVLFYIETNSNYYPGLEMPILPSEQQEEIVGAENSNSPIRLNPHNYPGTYFAYFDTPNKTYKCESGDKLRYKGDYYGILLSNNIGTDAEDYFERLVDFNSDNIDGLKIDFNRNHYLKMNLPNHQISNFDEFNAAHFDGPPQDFHFNAILWYYEIDDGSGNIVTNLYGIEFLNNPNDDDDECDFNNRRIRPYRKLVSNGIQDGVSYTFTLNINFNIDNDVLPLSYDPTTVYNMFGFELYQNILNNYAKLQDNFTQIISAFTRINEELFELRSLIYSQTDIDEIKAQIQNMTNLLELYSTFQFENSDTAIIETNYTGPYPTLKVNVINTKYAEILDVNISDVLNYNITTSGSSYIIPVPFSNQMLLNIYNDNNIIEEDAVILLNRDLSYKQAIDIYITPKMSSLLRKLKINIMYNDGAGNTSEKTLIDNIILPIDIANYDALDPQNSTFLNSYYNNENIHTYGQSIVTGITNTKIYLMEDLFTVGDYVYIDNFYLQSGSTIKDFSGVYYVTGHSAGDMWGNGADITINLPSAQLEMKTKPKISYYKGWKISILRVSSSPYSSIENRYKIIKKLL